MSALKAIIVEDLSKRYYHKFRSKVVLDSLSLSVQAGEILAIKGSNGSGKTTLLKTLTGLVKKNKGTIKIFGRDQENGFPEETAFLPEYPVFFLKQRVGEVLSMSAALSKRQIKNKQMEELLGRVGLEAELSDCVDGFSKGMRQRLALAFVLVAKSKLLLMDEPMSGLDPKGREEFSMIFKDLKNKGSTIVYSTHQSIDSEDCFDRSLRMVDGKIERMN